MVAAMALVATPACALINIPPDSIAGVANGVEELENLFQAITLSSFRTEEGQLNLLDVLADPEAELTVFAPIDDIWEAGLGSFGFTRISETSQQALYLFLLNHVVPGALAAADLSDGQVLEALSGLPLVVDIIGDSVYINATDSSAMVLVTDVPAGGSFVHVIDEVLLPFSPSDFAPAPEPEEEGPGSIASVAVSVPDLSILVEAVIAGGLLDAVADPAAELTVFAPTNDAFVALLGALGAESLDDIPVETLVEVLTYHVVPAVAFSTDLSDGQVLPTLNGAELVVDLTDGVVIDGIGSDATVVIPDVPAGLSVVHVIDTVLLPFGGDDDECALDFFPCGDPDDGSGCCSGICRGSVFFFPFYRFCSPF